MSDQDERAKLPYDSQKAVWTPISSVWKFENSMLEKDFMIYQMASW